ncbi:hypothetical protein A1354_16920 [Pseudomonas asplenii]|jgi:hypothetical protein|nr:hypothetical protein A1354_16920 [Pseudomonas asplenii]
MKFESLRYYLALIFLVLGCSIPVAGIAVWFVTEIMQIAVSHLNVLYIAAYIVVACVGFYVYGKRLRNII